MQQLALHEDAASPGDSRATAKVVRRTGIGPGFRGKGCTEVQDLCVPAQRPCRALASLARTDLADVPLIGR